jgi:hypothetical protein
MSDSLIWGCVLGSVQGGTNTHIRQNAKKKVTKFAHHTNESNWDTLSKCRKISRQDALFKAYSAEWAWKAIVDRLQSPHYLSWVDHEHKIRNRRQGRITGNIPCVNRTICLWNWLPAEILGTLPGKTNAFIKRVRKVINVVN